MDSTQLSSQEGLECTICFSYLHDPVLTICGHRFCSECLTLWLSKHENRCPIDNRKLSPNDTFPDNYTKREIAGKTVFCPNDGCAESVPAVNFEEHYDNCKYKIDKTENQTIDCPYKTVGCMFNTKTSISMSLPIHLENHISHHLQLMLKEYTRLDDNFQNCRNMCPHNEGCLQNGEHMDTLNGKLPYYLNDVYEKLTELDQRTKEYSIRINNLATQLDRCLSETNYAKLPMPDMNNGSLFWKINKFDEIIGQMKKDRLYAYYSPAFSTSELGYRFRVRLMLSSKNKDALAVLIHVIKGNYDFILKWPFVGEITISIIHPSNPDLRLKSIMKTNASEAFCRPTEDINPRGFGFSKTVTVSDLNKQGYLQDSTLIILVSVKSYDVND